MNENLLNDLQLMAPAMLRLHENMEQWNRMLRPSYLDAFQQIERAMGTVRQNPAFLQSLENFRLASSKIAEAMQASQKWQEQFLHTSPAMKAIEEFSRSHRTWIDAIKPMQDNISRLAQLGVAAQSSLGGVAERLANAQRIFEGLDFERIRQIGALTNNSFLRFENAIGSSTLAYERLTSSIQTIPDVIRLPSVTLPGATREVLVTGRALNRIVWSQDSSEEEDEQDLHLIRDIEEETSPCLGMLQIIDPALARIRSGAGNALMGKNVDRARHVLTSLRELWNHLLRHLAPESDVANWAPKAGSDLLHNGKPTRRARILYLCRNLNHGPLTDFIVEDSRALVKLVDFFNRVHEKEIELTDDQLRALLLRTDSWLMYIIQITGNHR